MNAFAWFIGGAVIASVWWFAVALALSAKYGDKQAEFHARDLEDRR